MNRINISIMDCGKEQETLRELCKKFQQSIFEQIVKTPLTDASKLHIENLIENINVYKSMIPEKP